MSSVPHKVPKFMLKILINWENSDDLLKKVLTNIVDLLVPVFDWKKNFRIYSMEGAEVIVTVNYLGKDSEDWKKLLGANCVVYVREGRESSNDFDNAVA